ncbi:uncharacterized protein PG986_002690 [Apiospora aurea]|uniref:Uncharacterized protein n=1 Tax=Apiospora aurea TaxID=335848 RepID=A0ABR1QPJ9_9PEZI
MRAQSVPSTVGQVLVRLAAPGEIDAPFCLTTFPGGGGVRGGPQGGVVRVQVTAVTLWALRLLSKGTASERREPEATPPLHAAAADAWGLTCTHFQWSILETGRLLQKYQEQHIKQLETLWAGDFANFRGRGFYIAAAIAARYSRGSVAQAVHVQYDRIRTDCWDPAPSEIDGSTWRRSGTCGWRLDCFPTLGVTGLSLAANSKRPLYGQTTEHSILGVLQRTCREWLIQLVIPPYGTWRDMDTGHFMDNAAGSNTVDLGFSAIRHQPRTSLIGLVSIRDGGRRSPAS